VLAGRVLDMRNRIYTTCYKESFIALRGAIFQESFQFEEWSPERSPSSWWCVAWIARAWPASARASARRPKARTHFARATSPIRRFALNW